MYVGHAMNNEQPLSRVQHDKDGQQQKRTAEARRTGNRGRNPPRY